MYPDFEQYTCSSSLSCTVILGHTVNIAEYVSEHHFVSHALYFQVQTRLKAVVSLQVVKGLRGGVQNVALKMLIGETRYQVNSFRQVRTRPCM